MISKFGQLHFEGKIKLFMTRYTERTIWLNASNEKDLSQYTQEVLNTYKQSHRVLVKRNRATTDNRAS